MKEKERRCLCTTDDSEIAAIETYSLIAELWFLSFKIFVIRFLADKERNQTKNSSLAYLSYIYERL